jgi:predicted nicotinamide N-methyase
VVRPADIDALLDQVVDDPEQNLPYWTELWPSGIALAAAIAGEPELVRGTPALELGCGIGITAAIALEAGADLIATDYAPESLILTRVNCLQHTGREPRTLQMNWRDPGDALLETLCADAPEGFPVVLAADVLYERRDIGPLLNLVEQIVAPGGMLWLAEPGRVPATKFLDEASQRGWTWGSRNWHGPWPDRGDEAVVARVHQLRREQSRDAS